MEIRLISNSVVDDDKAAITTVRQKQSCSRRRDRLLQAGARHRLTQLRLVDDNAVADAS